MERIDLDFNELKTEEEVYSLLAGQMHFPESFANNLDALDKELAEGLTENYGLRVIPGGEDAPLADFQKRFLKVLEGSSVQPALAFNVMESADGESFLREVGLKLVGK